MPANPSDLGSLISVHGVSAAQIQRATIIALVSFLFFLGTMFTFYLRQNILYFLLASGFLIVYLVMMLSLFAQRRSVVRVFENGLEYKKQRVAWNQMESASFNGGIMLTTIDGRSINLPAALADIDVLKRQIQLKTPGKQSS